MSIDGLTKTMENKSAMSDEKDRCQECGCLLSTEDEVNYYYCDNSECKMYKIIVRRKL